MGPKDHNPTTIILQRLQAEEALRYTERQETHRRLASMVHAIWNQRTFVFRLSLLGFLVGVIVALIIPPRYTSTTQLMPPDNQQGSALAIAASTAAAHGGAFSDLAGDLIGYKNSDVFVGILNSRTVQDQIIQQFDLKRVYGVSRMRDARKGLATRTGISVSRKSQMITIAVTDQSPERAQGMAKAYVDQLNRLVSELSTSSARRERIFLQGRIDEVGRDLEVAEKEFSEFSSKNSTLDIKEQGLAMIEAAASLQGRLISAQSELEGLRQIYSESNVRIRSAKALVEELQRELDKMGGKGQAGALSGDSQVADLYPSFRKLPLLGVAYADLYRRRKVEETLYEALTQQYELARVQEAKEIPTVKVLDAADLPEAHDFPPRRLIATSSTFAAFAAGILFLIITKIWKEKDPLDPSKTVATEIWIDLKQKRLLNPVHHPLHESVDPQRRSRQILSLLGLNSNGNGNGNGNGSTSAPKQLPEDDSIQGT